MQVYLLSKLVKAEPMLYSIWLAEQGDELPDHLEDREGMYVLENEGTLSVMESWIPMDIFKEQYSAFMPH